MPVRPVARATVRAVRPAPVQTATRTMPKEPPAEPVFPTAEVSPPPPPKRAPQSVPTINLRVAAPAVETVPEPPAPAPERKHAPVPSTQPKKSHQRFRVPKLNRTRKPSVPAVPEAPRWPDEVHLSSRSTIRPAVRRAAAIVIAVGALAVVGLHAQAEGGQLKTDLTGDVTAAKTALQGAKASFAAGDFAGASKQFKLAADTLHRANGRLADVGQFSGSGFQQGSIGSATDLLASGELLAQSGAAIADDAAAIRAGLTQSNNDLYGAGKIVLAKQPDLKNHLAQLDDRLKLLDYQIGVSRDTGSIPELKTAVDQLGEVLPQTRDQLKQTRAVVDQLPYLLGADHFREYLVWFENPAELRPTGGFIGTYGRLTLDGGAVKELLVDSIYNPANQANSVVQDNAPTPYGRFYGDNQTPKWGMQDSNWSPNLPTAAKKFQDFYEKGGGSTTDGVIALTINPVLEILRLLGPIDMPEYGYTLDADNFQTLIQNDQYQKGVEGDTDPKKILRDFTPKLLARISAASFDQQQQIVKIIADAAARRELTMYFDNPAAEKLLEGTTLEGVLHPEPNALALVDTNIAGRKSSKDIRTGLTETVTIGDDGAATVKVTIRRTHTGETSADPNMNFARIFVPKGSIYQGSDGFTNYAPPTVTEEEGFMVIAGWTDLTPGESREITATYRLPGKVKLSRGEVTLPYYRQPGMQLDYRFEVILPTGYTWRDGQGTIDGRTLSKGFSADRDLLTTLTFKKD